MVQSWQAKRKKESMLDWANDFVCGICIVAEADKWLGSNIAIDWE